MKTLSSDTLFASPAPPASRGAAAPAIYYGSPLMIGAGAAAEPQIDRIARLGFDTLLIAPPCQPGMSGSLFDVSDPTHVHPALGGGATVDYLRDLSARLAAHGMALMVDVALDHLAADAPLVAAHPALFRTARRDMDAPLDPRRPMERAEIAITRR